MNSPLDLIKTGKIDGFSNEIPEMIMTSISRVFIFHKSKKVLKIYRRDNTYWNTNFSDLSKGSVRKDFIKQDFEWNRYFSPEIYLSLKEAAIENNIVKLIDPAGGDELVIEMNPVDTSHFLISTLASKEDLASRDFYAMGEQLVSLKKGFAEKPNLNKNWFQIFSERIEDLRVWMEVIPAISKESISDCVAYLKNYANINKPRFEGIKDSEMVATIDAHGENAMFHDGKISFIDIFLPKEVWRLAPQDIDILRIALDIYVLRGESAYRDYLKGIKNKTIFENQDELLYLIYLSALMSCIQYTIAENTKNRKPIAEKYYSFFKENLAKGISSLKTQ